LESKRVWITVGIKGATVFVPLLTNKHGNKVDGALIEKEGKHVDYCQYEFNLGRMHHEGLLMDQW